MSNGGLLKPGSYDAVFFDLDGTLVDTAPDMVAILQQMMETHGLPEVPYEVARNNVSHGAVGLLKLGFPDEDATYLGPLHREYLQHYARSLCIRTKIFSPLGELLELFNDHGVKWGVVTNKPEGMTVPLMEQLGIASSAACIVGGDTLEKRKPHPAPMFHAAEQAAVHPARVIYVGDAERDIEAGKAAGMATVSVGYGYITAEDDPTSWGADVFAADTMQLFDILKTAVELPAND